MKHSQIVRQFFFCLAACVAISPGMLAAAESAGLGVLDENPRYFTYDGEPVFLLGRTFWNSAASSTAYDYVRDIETMAAHGGNLARLGIFWPGHGESEHGLLPWARETAGGLYNLEFFNKTYFERLRAYLALAREHRTVVVLELFDHPAIKGGGARWGAHPMNPAKNVNYGEEVFGTSSADRDFFLTLPPHQDNPVALHYQQELVRKILDETLDFRNVIYSLGNECPSPPGWNVYWADFIREYAKEAGRDVLVTNMWQRDHPAFDTFDLQDAQSPFRVRRASAAAMWDAFQALTAWQMEHDRIKPVFDSGQMGGAPGSHILHQLWMSFVGGTAGIRYHRAAPVHPRPGTASEVTVGDWEDPRYLEQLRWMQHLRQFIDGMEFWTMTPLWDATAEGEAYGFGRAGEEYVFYLPQGGSIAVQAPGAAGSYEGYWFNPDTGETGEAWQFEVDADAGSQHFEAPDDRDWVLHLRLASA